MYYKGCDIEIGSPACSYAKALYEDRKKELKVLGSITGKLFELSLTYYENNETKKHHIEVRSRWIKNLHIYDKPVNISLPTFKDFYSMRDFLVNEYVFLLQRIQRDFKGSYDVSSGVIESIGRVLHSIEFPERYDDEFY
ncbi:hypothetical protein V7114_19500 [Neobacillus niacini]|uniref:hypothetical protein n=1 Tax=Neobacillus niacini TaxID=86668 RepID=UPI002FFE250C